jgi:hypothetical protein
MEWIWDWDWEPGVVEEELDCWDWDTELLLELGPLLTSTIDLRSGSAVTGLVLTLSTAIFLPNCSNRDERERDEIGEAFP